MRIFQIVAHRLSTIRQADQIVVMDKHKIVDVGQHDALLDKSSKYQDLIKRQSVMIRDVSSSGLRNLGIPNKSYDMRFSSVKYLDTVGISILDICLVPQGKAAVRP